MAPTARLGAPTRPLRNAALLMTSTVLTGTLVTSTVLTGMVLTHAVVMTSTVLSNTVLSTTELTAGLSAGLTTAELTDTGTAGVVPNRAGTIDAEQTDETIARAAMTGRPGGIRPTGARPSENLTKTVLRVLRLATVVRARVTVPTLPHTSSANRNAGRADGKRTSARPGRTSLSGRPPTHSISMCDGICVG